jgi:hypothetical protein
MGTGAPPPRGVRALRPRRLAHTVPIQTASTVPVGTVRASGQASLGVYCLRDLDRCAFGGSTPELRSRWHRPARPWDLGGSAYFVGKLEGSAEWGPASTRKVELWRAPSTRRASSARRGVGVPIAATAGHNRQVYETGVVVPVRTASAQAARALRGRHFPSAWSSPARARPRRRRPPAGSRWAWSAASVPRSASPQLRGAAALLRPRRHHLGLGFLFDVNGRYQRRGPPLRRAPSLLRALRPSRVAPRGRHAPELEDP